MLVVRPVRPTDLDGVAAIYAHYVLTSLATFETEPPDARWWRNRVDDVTAAGWPFLVAVDGGQVLGYAFVAQYRPRPGYARTVEDSVYVAPGHAGRGIGRELLAAVLDDAAAAGARQVVAVIASDDAAASVALHARAGFVEVGRLRSVGFKLGRWSDTTLMQHTLPSAPEAAPHTDPMRSVGVEEEFLLVTPEGRPRAIAAAVLRHAADEPSSDLPGGDLEKEFKQEQIETSTHPCTELADLVEQVRSGRSRADELARRAGARVAALATAPQVVESTVLPDRRAYAIRAEFGQTARDQLTCGCHVHVEVADDDEGVRILDALRPWTPILLALSGNSPSWQGTHTGYASYRSQVWGRWPTAGPTAPFGDAAGYRRVIDALLTSGAILDEGMVYFDARLSSRYPTVEVRVADVCLDADDTALQAALVRALADTTSTIDPPRTELLRAAGWRAARSGLTGDLVDPLSGKPVPAADAVGTLVKHVRPALVASGDLDWVERQVATVLRRGNGAIQQLGWRAEGADDDEVVRRAVDRTVL